MLSLHLERIIAKAVVEDDQTLTKRACRDQQKAALGLSTLDPTDVDFINKEIPRVSRIASLCWSTCMPTMIKKRHATGNRDGTCDADADGAAVLGRGSRAGEGPGVMKTPTSMTSRRCPARGGRARRLRAAAAATNTLPRSAPAPQHHRRARPPSTSPPPLHT